MKILTYNEYLFESKNDYELITESFGMNIKKYLKYLLNKVKNLSKNKKKEILTIGITSLLLFTGYDEVKKYINDPEIKNELNLEEYTKTLFNEILSDVNFKMLQEFKDPTNMKLSQNGWDLIKYEEGDIINKGEPVLTAYKIGDGMITIGWGHAEKIKDSKYKVGDVITRNQAQKLLQEDLKNAADGVRRMFSQWQEKGIYIKLTQEQFDVLVSMAFNMGITGLRQTDLIKEIKKGNYQKAGELIKKTGLRSGFSGLNKRREKESELFLSYTKL
jgi:lysozyme